MFLRFSLIFKPIIPISLPVAEILVDGVERVRRVGVACLVYYWSRDYINQ